MPLTRSFRETVAKRASSDPAFRAALVEEAVQNILDGDVETALGQLRDVVNATMGFEALAAATGVPKTSLMRMLGRRQPSRGQPERHPQRARAAHRRAYRRARRNHTFSSRPGLNESGRHC